MARDSRQLGFAKAALRIDETSLQLPDVADLDVRVSGQPLVLGMRPRKELLEQVDGRVELLLIAELHRPVEQWREEMFVLGPGHRDVRVAMLGRKHEKRKRPLS